MLKYMHHKMTLPLSMILVSMALSLPVFGQTGVSYSVDNTINPNAQNATNLDSVVPPAARGTAVGYNQLANPAKGSTVMAVIGGSNSVPHPARDMDITAKIKHTLYEDAVTSGNDIHVTTDNGVVILTGEVHVDHEAMEAAKIAWTTPGVREVVNQLVVTNKRIGNG
jgi:osmotically-inducible protein OsmY